MKKAILFATFLISFGLYAQKSNTIKLSKGQSITISTTSDVDMEMGPGIAIKNSSASTNTVVVTGEDNKNYTVATTLKRLVLITDMMGKQNNYDSDKKEDQDSEIGKTLSEKVGKQVVIFVNKVTGDVMPEKKSEGKDSAGINPMTAIMQSFDSGGDDAIVKGMFFIIPVGKKLGNAWVDSTSQNDFTTKNTYTIKSIKDNIATVGLEGDLFGTTTLEIQGTSFDLSMNTKTIGDIIVDIKSGLVHKRNTNADISGNIDIMGQSNPITAKAKIISENKF